MEGSEVVVVWVCGTLAVIGAIGLIISRKAVHSALWVALTMINLAVLYSMCVSTVMQYMDDN